MPCDRIQLEGGGVAVVCSTERKAACRFCGARGAKSRMFLCDFPLGPKTCDALMCRDCATTVGKDRDYCPKHLKGQPVAVEEAPVGNITNDFSWSVSRSGRFDTCLKRYWLYHYGSWGGWEKSADPRTRKIYLLKKLQNRYGWWGDMVHRGVHNILAKVQNGHTIDVEQEQIRLLAQMKKEWSRSDRLEHREHGGFGLLEHEYAEDVTRSQWKEGPERLSRCLGNFLNSDVFRHIKQVWEQPWGQEEWLELEEKKQFTIGDVPVWVVLDFALRDAPGLIHVYDWKTGRPRDKDRDQMLCYTAYAMTHWEIPVEKLRVHLVYLNGKSGADDRVYGVSPEEMDAFGQEAHISMTEMAGVLVDGDKDRNVVLPEERFPMRINDRECQRCEYRGICER